MAFFVYFKVAVMLAMLLLFLLEANQSWSKWKEKKTSITDAVVHVEEILYPSISFCKRYTYDDFIDADLLNSSSFNTALSLITAQVWPRGRVVQMLSHPRMLNLTYPCVTNQDGTDPGKPCSFPDVNNRSGCHLYGTLTPACYTRYLDNGSIYYLEGDLDFWGYCQPGCGEQEAQAPERWSLAEQDSLWETSLYDLRTWEAGVCHTYNPPAPSHTDLGSRLSALLGDKVFGGYYLQGFDVYLHQKGQFWPRADMAALGQSEKIILEKDTEMEGSFMLSRVRRLHKGSAPCTEETSTSLTSCIKKYLTHQVGCDLDLLGQKRHNEESLTEARGKNQEEAADGKGEACFTNPRLKTLYSLFIWMKRSSWQEVSNTTGCLPRCSHIRYTWKLRKRGKVDWRTNWVSSFYLEPRSAHEEESVEYLTYDQQAMVGDLGGYLGLFLGWSLYSLLAEVGSTLSEGLGSKIGCQKREDDQVRL